MHAIDISVNYDAIKREYITYVPVQNRCEIYSCHEEIVAHAILPLHGSS